MENNNQVQESNKKLGFSGKYQMIKRSIEWTKLNKEKNQRSLFKEKGDQYSYHFSKSLYQLQDKAGPLVVDADAKYKGRSRLKQIQQRYHPHGSMLGILPEKNQLIQIKANKLQIQKNSAPPLENCQFDNIIANMNKNVAMEDDNSEAKEIAPSPGEVLNNLVSYIKTPVEDKHSASPFMVKYNFRAHSQDNNFMVIQNQVSDNTLNINHYNRTLAVKQIQSKNYNKQMRSHENFYQRSQNEVQKEIRTQSGGQDARMKQLNFEIPVIDRRQNNYQNFQTIIPARQNKKHPVQLSVNQQNTTALASNSQNFMNIFQEISRAPSIRVQDKSVEKRKEPESLGILKKKKEKKGKVIYFAKVVDQKKAKERSVDVEQQQQLYQQQLYQQQVQQQLEFQRQEEMAEYQKQMDNESRVKKKTRMVKRKTSQVEEGGESLQPW